MWSASTSGGIARGRGRRPGAFPAKGVACCRRLADSRDGATVVETALTLPLLLLALLGLFDFCRYAYTQATLTYAAGEATRFAVVREGRLTAAELRSYARARLHALDAADADVQSSTAADAGTGADAWEVTISYPFAFVTPVIFPGGITLSASARAFVVPPAPAGP